MKPMLFFEYETMVIELVFNSLTRHYSRHERGIA